MIEPYALARAIAPIPDRGERSRPMEATPRRLRVSEIIATRPALINVLPVCSIRAANRPRKAGAAAEG